MCLRGQVNVNEYFETRNEALGRVKSDIFYQKVRVPRKKKTRVIFQQSRVFRAVTRAEAALTRRVDLTIRDRTADTSNAVARLFGCLYPVHP